MKIFLKPLLYLVLFSTLHFGYDLTGWSFLTPFCGIDESIFQHLKMAFWAYLLTNLIEFFIVKQKTKNTSSFWYPRFLSAVFVPWIIFLIWYLMPAIFGRLQSNLIEVFWAISVTYISGIFGVSIERSIEQTKISKTFRIVIISLLIISAFLYIKFTYTLPWVDMFVNPEAI